MTMLFIFTSQYLKIIDCILACALHTDQIGLRRAASEKICCAYEGGDFISHQSAFGRRRFIHFKSDLQVSSINFNGIIGTKTPKLLDSSRTPC